MAKMRHRAFSEWDIGPSAWIFSAASRRISGMALSSGLIKKRRTGGVITVIRSPGTEAAANQSIHEMSIPHKSLANCVEATLVDDAVMKIQALVSAAL